MRKTRVWITSTGLTCVILTMAVVAWAQGRKAGLWEITTTMTWQQSPLPPGMTPPPNSPFSGTPRTTQVCITQAMIDKYGAPVPQTRAGNCVPTNVVKTDHGMTGDIVCTGRMTGKGTIKSSWEDPEHAKGTVHFTGTGEGRNGTIPLEWTSESTSVFKNADCGDVKPVPMPADK